MPAGRSDAAQLGELGDGQAAVLGEHGRVGVRRAWCGSRRRPRSSRVLPCDCSPDNERNGAPQTREDAPSSPGVASSGGPGPITCRAHDRRETGGLWQRFSCERETTLVLQPDGYAADAGRSLRRRVRDGGSILTPGPIVDDAATPFRYRPFDGRGLGPEDLVEHRVVVLEQRSRRRSSPCRSARARCRSGRCGTRPCRALNSPTVLPTSVVTVPVFGFGIRPRGPSVRPSLPTWPIRSGVAMATSKSRKPALDPRRRGRRCRRRRRRPPRPRGPRRPRRTPRPARLAGAVRQRHGAADHLVGLAGVDAEPERDLDRLVELAGWPATSRARTPRSAGRAGSRSKRRGRVGVLLAVLGHVALLLGAPSWSRIRRRGPPPAETCAAQSADLDAHRAGGAGDLGHRAVDVDRVEVGHLRLGDLAHLAPA